MRRMKMNMNIKEDVFYGFDDAVGEVIIPEGKIFVIDGAFAYASEITTLYVSSTVKEIGTNAFYQLN